MSGRFSAHAFFCKDARVAAGVLLATMLAGAGPFAARAQVPSDAPTPRNQVREPVQRRTPPARPSPAEGRPPALERQFRRARMAWRTGASLLEAKTRLDRVLKALPEDVQARMLRAEVLLSMGRPEEAFEDVQRVVEMRPDDGHAHLLYVEAARKTSRLDEARRTLERAGQHLPKNAAMHARLSWNAMLLDRLDQAEALGRVALALDSTDGPAYRQLARVFSVQERPDEAAAVLARGLRAGALRPVAIRTDERLRLLVEHERLRPWMGNR